MVDDGGDTVSLQSYGVGVVRYWWELGRHDCEYTLVAYE